MGNAGAQGEAAERREAYQRGYEFGAFAVEWELRWDLHRAFDAGREDARHGYPSAVPGIPMTGCMGGPHGHFT